ncbi:MAG: acyloxyacyl hydrolase [Cyanobacteria bacterium J06638_22]
MNKSNTSYPSCIRNVAVPLADLPRSMQGNPRFNQAVLVGTLVLGAIALAPLTPAYASPVEPTKAQQLAAIKPSSLQPVNRAADATEEMRPQIPAENSLVEFPAEAATATPQALFATEFIDPALTAEPLVEERTEPGWDEGAAIAQTPTPEPIEAGPSEAEPIEAELEAEPTEADPIEAEPTEEASPVFGADGSERWYIHGGGATTLGGDTSRFGLVGAGASHFFADGHSINLELNSMVFDQPGDDAVGLNLSAILRWHFVREADWSLYIDGGAGILGTTNDVPRRGSSFNFTPQVGGGTTIRLNDEQRLMVGVRWHHISNADLFSGNPGLDTIFGYVGLNLPFSF